MMATDTGQWATQTGRERRAAGGAHAQRTLDGVFDSIDASLDKLADLLEDEATPLSAVPATRRDP